MKTRSEKDPSSYKYERKGFQQMLEAWGPSMSECLSGVKMGLVLPG